jgi:hypothetical protein
MHTLSQLRKIVEIVIAREYENIVRTYTTSNNATSDFVCVCVVSSSEPKTKKEKMFFLFYWSNNPLKIMFSFLSSRAKGKKQQI